MYLYIVYLYIGKTVGPPMLCESVSPVRGCRCPFFAHDYFEGAQIKWEHLQV